MISTLSILALLLPVAVLSAAAVELAPVPPTPVPDDRPVIPWVAADAEPGAGALLWEHRSEPITTRLWAAQNEAGLLIRIAVSDPEQHNPHRERTLWRGDCVYLSLDAWGESIGDEDRFPVDDATFILGLGADGPEARCSQHGDAEREGDAGDAVLRGITRDEDAAVTTYDLVVPWAYVHSAPGISDALGLAVTVAHKDAEGNDQHWGRFRAKRDQARELVVHRLADPATAEVMEAVAGRNLLLRDEEQGVVRIAVATASEQPAVVRASGLPGEDLELRLPGDDRIHRLILSVAASELGINGARVDMRVLSGAGEDERSLGTADFQTLDQVEARVAARVAELAAAAEHPVARWHFASIGHVLADGRNRRPFHADEDGWLEGYLEVLERVESHLPDSRLDLADHSARGTPLVGAFVSSADRTLQFYSLQLPFDWDPDQAYPLTVYLHGYGTPEPMQGLALAFDNRHQDTLFTWEPSDPDNVPALHRGFVLAPWGRGNGFYEHSAEHDVWQSIAEVQDRFAIDRDRRYISGFSMGSHGAWRLATYRPDAWAGVNVAAGFGDWAANTTLAHLRANTDELPVAMWCGELDKRMLAGGEVFAAELEARGQVHRFQVVERLPHTYPYLEYSAQIGWLMDQPSRIIHPSYFRFRTDDRRYPGRNGVSLALGRRLAEPASLICRIDGRTVHLDTEQAEGFQLDCARLGLTGAEPVTVIWNGEQVYAGEPGTIAVPEGFQPWGAFPAVD